MSNLLQGLNKEQLKAVTHSGGPLLIIAGAGTGKTSVITRRIAYLIEQGMAKPNEILALTFTEKAASEMEERVDQLLPLGHYDFWVSTFHAFCQRILEQHGLDIGLSNSFKLLDSIQQWILIKKNFEQFNLNYYKPLGSPNRHIDSLLDHFSKCKDEMVTPEAYLTYANSVPKDNEEDQVESARLIEVAQAYGTYQKILLENEFLDFGDLINYTIELFHKRPAILKQYQQQFKYILVDEFQDTNYAQYELIKLLAGQKNQTNLSPEGKFEYPNHLMVVGDDDQSIYKFRGASVSNILKLKDDFKGAEELTLVQNYRSSQGVLDLAYEFIKQNDPDRLEAKLGINKKLIANLTDPTHIEVLEADDLSSELNMVTNKIVKLKQEFPKSSWNDFAILVRANSTADEILPRLDHARIPYTFVANKGLYKKRIVADLLNYFKLLDNHHESSALYRVFGIEKFRISQFELAALSNFAKRKTISLFEALQRTDEIPELSVEAKAKITSLLTTLDKHAQAINQKSALELCVLMIQDLGLHQTLMEDTLENAESREHLDQFFKKIERFAEGSDDKSLHGFMDFLDLEMQAGSEGDIKFDPNTGPESLKVMTVHSSKGLEFKFVFLIGMVDQRFPSRAKRDAIQLPGALIQDILPEGDAHLQEERRLFYVAVTRAKSHLYFSWGKDYGGAKTKKPSIFLTETGLVPGDHVSKATGKVIFNLQVLPSDIEVYQNLPSEFSFSDISTFENCPLDYKFRNYLKIPMPGAPQLSFGSTIHKTLQLIANHYQAHHKIIDSVTALKWYEESWLDDWYHDKAEKEQYKQDGVTMIMQMMEDLKLLKPEIKYIEESFKISFGEYILKGRIDRADVLPDKTCVVVDYKTNNAPKSKNKKDVDQLKLYQLALEEGFGEHVSGMFYWHLRDNVKAEQTPATAEELAALKSSILNSIENIRHTIKYDKFTEVHERSKQHDCKYQYLL